MHLESVCVCCVCACVLCVPHLCAHTRSTIRNYAHTHTHKHTHTHTHNTHTAAYEIPGHSHLDDFMLVSKATYAYAKRDPLICEKRPNMSIWHKHDTHTWNTGSYAKRDLLICEKRPNMSIWHTHTYSGLWNTGPFEPWRFQNLVRPGNREAHAETWC